MKNPLIPVVVIVVLFILLTELPFGCISRWKDPSRDDAHYSHWVAPQNWMLVHIAETPAQSARSLHAVADVVEIADSNGAIHSCHGKILLYFAKDSTFDSPVAFGDELLLLATPQQPSGSDNPHQFDYRRHLRNKGILYTDYIRHESYRKLGNSRSGFMSFVTALRQRLISVVRLSQLTPSQQGIAEALFLGWDNDLDDDTQMHFRQAGITHLLCVSGLHVGIVSLMVGYLLFFIGNHRRGRIAKGLIKMVVIWFFVMLTGMAPGTMRAALMFSFIAVGQMLYSRPPTLNAVAASALVLLVGNPLLLFDVGFQLSYAAVVGLLLLTPRFQEWLPLPAFIDRLWTPLSFLAHKLHSLLFVSLSAQLATAPFILYYFHQFPLYFLVANMVVVPFAGLLLGSVIVMVLLAWWPGAFALAGFLTSKIIAATEWLTSAIGRWPYSLVESIYFDRVMFLLVLFAVGTLAWWLAGRSWRRLTLPLLFSVAMIAWARHAEARCASQTDFDIYRLGNHTAMEFFAGHESYLLCDTQIAHNPTRIDYQTNNNLLHHQARRAHILPLDTAFADAHLMVRDRFVSFHGITMRIVDRSNYRQRSTSRPQLRYLLLRESPYVTVAELQQQYQFDTLIIASQNSQRRRAAWQHQCDSLMVPYIDMR